MVEDIGNGQQSHADAFNGRARQEPGPRQAEKDGVRQSQIHDHEEENLARGFSEGEDQRGGPADGCMESAPGAGLSFPQRHRGGAPVAQQIVMRTAVRDIITAKNKAMFLLGGIRAIEREISPR